MDDGPGGAPGEFAMLNLRLSRGLIENECVRRFGEGGRELFSKIRGRVLGCPGSLVEVRPDRVRFTPEGFLVSNALLSRLLD